MAAAQHDITIEQGATFQMNLVWKDAGGTPINLTGYSARMQVRRTYRADTAELSLTSPSGGITLGGALGTIAIIATAAQTAAITVLVGVYDLELVDAGGTVTRLIEGAVTISPEVTK